MKGYLISMMATVCCVASFSMDGYAQEATVNGVKYKVIDNKAYIAGGELFNGKKSDELTIPEKVTVDGKDYTVGGFYMYWHVYPANKYDLGWEEYQPYYYFPKVLNLPASVTTCYTVGGPHVDIDHVEMMPLQNFFQYASGESFEYVNILTPGEYNSFDGVLYNGDLTEAFYVPKCRKSEVKLAPQTKSIAANFNYVYNPGIIKGIESIEFNENLETIGENAFRGNPWLKSIKLGNKVTSIDAGAFEECAALEDVILGANVTEIGESAFGGCSSLQSVKVDAGKLEGAKGGKISSLAFAGCEKLEDVVLPDNITEIGSLAFENCVELKSVTFPLNLEDVKGDAFRNCQSLTEYNVAENATGIELYEQSLYTKGLGKLMLVPINLNTLNVASATTEIAAKVCEGYMNLRNVNFPKGLEKIGEAAFMDCRKLVEIELPEIVSAIGESAFALSDVGVTITPHRNIVLPDGLKEIPPMCFYNNVVTSIVWPTSLTSIGERAFEDVEWGEGISFTFPNSLATVGKSAFASRKISKIDNLTFGTLRRIGDYAFKGITPKEIYCAVWTPPMCEGDPFNIDTYSTATLYVPYGTLETYYNTAPWSYFINIKGHEYAGVSAVEGDSNVSVNVEGGNILIGCPEGTAVEIYSTDGRRVYQGEGSCSVSLSKGVFMVRVGRNTQKVIL